MSSSTYWRLFFVILGIIISFVGQILWNIPLNESTDEGGQVPLWSDDLGWNFEVLPFIVNGFMMNCFIGPYLLLSGIMGRPFLLSYEAWNQKAPDPE
jgi:hypothetical protein|tara:strand:+ start:167 stop:457 length:291 start_codon:yes stop_codon:yes gene_type:complete